MQDDRFEDAKMKKRTSLHKGEISKDREQHRSGSPNCGKSKPGTFTKEKGILAFSEIKQYLDNGWKRKWDKEQMVPYAYNMHEKQWVGYDDEQSIRLKIDYLKRYQLGGAMTWALPLDSFGNTKDKTSRFTLHRAIKKFLEDTDSENTRTTEGKKTLSYSLWNKPERTTKSIPYKSSTENEVQNSFSSGVLSLLEEPNKGFRTTDRTNPTWKTTMEPNIFITESPTKNLEQKRKTKPSISTTDNTLSLTKRNSQETTTYSSTMFPKQYQTLPVTFGSSDHNLINVPVLEVVFPGRNNGGERETSKKSKEESEYSIKSGVNIFQGNAGKGLFSLKKEPSLHLKQGQSVWDLRSTSKPSSSPTTPESEKILPCDEETETSTDKLKQEDSLTEVFKCPSLFGIYRDVRDCTSFFQCVWQVPFRYKCSPGTAWNDRIQSCDWPANTGCIL
ncbi:CHIA chitinase [Octopus vulgaris]|uniref:CHIA chitinase n=1 Tax=Octopus vulgaris TaxID=6645 RepID=A0AA36BJP3_OCTVU|nr:CHIA chitinase [Octopus vulgaris]